MKLQNLIHILILIACVGFLSKAQAVGPDTDGTIPGSNNGEGIVVLVSRTGGVWNTGTGFEALNHLTSGNQNTATDLRALNSDINGGFNTATGAMLLNEFLKEHRKNEEQEATIAQLKSIAQKQEAANAEQQKQIEALTGGLQKVSAEIEMSKTGTQTAVNNQ